MSESSPPSSMYSFVYGRVCAWCFGTRWKDSIGFAFLDVRLIPIDLFGAVLLLMDMRLGPIRTNGPGMINHAEPDAVTTLTVFLMQPQIVHGCVLSICLHGHVNI